MMRWIIILLCCSALSAAPFRVEKIEIQNRRYTQEWVILRELQFAVGDTIDQAMLEQARLRLLNVDLFHEVDMTSDSSGTVFIKLNEEWHIFPILNLAFAEGQLSEVLKEPDTFMDKVIATAGLADFNFRGNGEDANALLQFGAADGFGVSYSTRWLSPGLPYAVRADFQNLRINDRRASVQDSSRHLRNVKASFQAATRAGAKSRLGIELVGQTIKRIETNTAVSKLSYDQFWVNPFVILDHRDLEWYPSRGALVSTKIDFAFGTENFSRWGLDARHYIPLSQSKRPPVVAMRANYGTSSSATPFWAHYYFGFNRGFRGYEINKSESATFISGEAELRVPLTKETHYDVPYLGSIGKRWPFAIYGELFLQRTQLQLATKRQDLLGYGFGLLFRAPFVQFVETAFTFDRDGEFSANISSGINF